MATVISTGFKLCKYLPMLCEILAKCDIVQLLCVYESVFGFSLQISIETCSEVWRS